MGKKKQRDIDYNDMYIDDVLTPKKFKKVKKGDVRDVEEASDTVTRAASKASKQVKKEEGPSVQINID